MALWCFFGIVVAAGLWSALSGSVRPSAKESYERGRAQFRAGLYDKAIATFTDALKADPSHAEAFHYTRQTLGYRDPVGAPADAGARGGKATGDVEVAALAADGAGLI